MSVLPRSKGVRIPSGNYAGRFAASLLLVFSIGGASLLLAFYLILTRPLPDTYSGVYFALRNLSSYLVPILVFSMTAYVLLITVAIAILCGYTFHKIAGPLYRMELAMNNFESGFYIRPVFLREGDQIVELAEAYNGFVAGLREDRRECLTALEHAERLCLVDASACRSEREEALSRISALLSRYR
ncbi:MAG: hypothetical protein HY896_01285 [Deltaproteobacteria bacterium]|nr:hypothetical protein [Deltaproteobacteria bacterium]